MVRLRSWLLTPLVLLLAGLAPALLGVRALLAGLRPASPVAGGGQIALGMALLWLCLMAWITLSRLRPLEPRPMIRDVAPDRRAQQVEATARGLATVGDATGIGLLPACLAAAGFALLGSPRVAGPALVGVTVALVGLVGVARAARALVLLGRPRTASPLAELREGMVEVGGVVERSDADGFTLRDASGAGRFIVSGAEVVTARGRTTPLAVGLSVQVVGLARREGDAASDDYRSNHGVTFRLTAPPGGRLLLLEDDEAETRHRVAVFVAATAVVVGSVLGTATFAGWLLVRVR